MSHPHDGFDYERNLDFWSSGDFYFAWVGDESNSTMGYLDVNFDFSQFDRDNMNRWLTAGYLSQANSILASIYASPRASQARALIAAADTQATTALGQYAAMNYPASAMSAKAAYQGIVNAATAAGVKLETQNYTADYKAKGRSSKFIDRVNYKRLQP